MEITDIVIPDGVKEIGDYAFANSLVNQIVIPDSVQKLGQNAFSRCPVLTCVEVSENVSVILVIAVPILLTFTGILSDFKL